MNATAVDAVEPTAALQPASQRILRGTLLVLLALSALVLGLFASVAFGPVQLSAEEIWTALWHSAEGPAATIVWNLRLPRAFASLLVGMNLALAGALLQTGLENPLASPEIVGVTSGAGLAAAIVLLVIGGLPVYLPLAAFLGGLAAALLVLTLSWQPGSGTAPLRVILSGVAVATMLGAFTSFLMVYYSDRVQAVVQWMAGSLSGASWNQVRMVLPYSAIGLVGALFLAPALNVMRLGDEAARSLGVRTGRVRMATLACGALLAGAAVSAAGLVGFVGLMVPHMVRMLGGHNLRVLLPASALGGALLLVWADFGARCLSELPVGILTAVLGGPYFVYLLHRRKGL